MKKTLFFLPLILLVSCAAPTPKPERINLVELMRPPSPEEVQAIKSELNLTREQEESMRALNEKYHRQARRFMDEYSKAKNDLLSLMNDPTPDQRRINERVKDIHEMEGTALMAEATYWKELGEILDRQQRKKLWDLFREKRLKEATRD